MSTKKKLLIAITAVSIALVITLVTLVVVIVASTQLASSNVVVEYVATDVSARVSANYIVGGVSTPLTVSGSTEGEEYIDFYPGKESNGTLSVEDTFTLTRDNPEIAFEYIFVNTANNADISLTLSSTIDSTLINVTYAYNSTQSSDYSALATSTTYTTQVLNANATSDATKYIYIIVSVANTEEDFSCTGSFTWTMTRA